MLIVCKYTTFFPIKQQYGEKSRRRGDGVGRIGETNGWETKKRYEKKDVFIAGGQSDHTEVHIEDCRGGWGSKKCE